MATAKGEFHVKLTPQTDEGREPVPGRMLIDKTFEGELAGVSQGQMLAAHGTVKGSAGYVAIERVTGSLAGKTGSFCLQHWGLMERGKPTLEVVVVPDSGTDELAGLTGKMRIIIEGGQHRYEFDYELS